MQQRLCTYSCKLYKGVQHEFSQCPSAFYNSSGDTVSDITFLFWRGVPQRGDRKLCAVKESRGCVSSRKSHTWKKRARVLEGVPWRWTEVGTANEQYESQNSGLVIWLPWKDEQTITRRMLYWPCPWRGAPTKHNSLLPAFMLLFFMLLFLYDKYFCFYSHQLNQSINIGINVLVIFSSGSNLESLVSLSVAWVDFNNKLVSISGYHSSIVSKLLKTRPTLLVPKLLKCNRSFISWGDISPWTWSSTMEGFIAHALHNI